MATKEKTGMERVYASISEEAHQTQVINMARAFGWHVAHFRTVRVQRKDGTYYYATPVQADGEGFPDLVLVRGNRVIFAELKRESGKVEPAQLQWIEKLNPTPAEVYLWRPSDMDEVERVLR